MLITVAVMLVTFSMPAFAITEAEVQAAVDNSSKEAVSGNVFVWFLCAIAFLKVSQKIDSFMSGLGINVGNTGGSMLAEAMIATRGLGITKGGFSGKGFASGATGATTAGASFFAGGLAGAVGRNFTRGAVSSVTNGGGTGGIGGMMFANSLSKNGGFAHNVIGAVAKGSISQVGSITGETASQSLTSYMNISENENMPAFSNVEIGGGRITGTETSVASPEGISFAMYNADQYTEPSKGDFSTETAVDGSKWYKQYAMDHVEKTPYMGDDGKILYNENLVRKLPDTPRRKDRI